MHLTHVCWIELNWIIRPWELDSGTRVLQSWCYPFLMLPSFCMQKLWDDCKGLMNTCNLMRKLAPLPLMQGGPKMQTFFSSLSCARGRIIVWSAIPQLPRGAKKWPHSLDWCSNNTTDFQRMILERCYVSHPKLLNPIKKPRQLLPFLSYYVGPIMIVNVMQLKCCSVTHVNLTI